MTPGTLAPMPQIMPSTGLGSTGGGNTLGISLGVGSPFTIWSQSRSSGSSWSRSGLPADVKKKYLQFLTPLFSRGGLLGSVFESALTGKPNQNIWDNLTKTAWKNYQAQLRPAIQQNIRSVIGSLADRGVLDSSVASRTLGGLLGNYQQILANYLAQLQQRALFYPLEAMRVAQIFPALVQILRESQSGSSQSSSSTSYNPSPAINLAMGLIGL